MYLMCACMLRYVMTDMYVYVQMLCYVCMLRYDVFCIMYACYGVYVQNVDVCVHVCNDICVCHLCVYVMKVCMLCVYVCMHVMYVVLCVYARMVCM